MTTTQEKIRGMMLCERPSYSRAQMVTPKVSVPFYSRVSITGETGGVQRPKFRSLTSDKRFLIRHQACVYQAETAPEGPWTEEQGQTDQHDRAATRGYETTGED